MALTSLALPTGPRGALWKLLLSKSATAHSHSEAWGAPILLRKSNGVIHDSQDAWVFGGWHQMSKSLEEGRDPVRKEGAQWPHTAALAGLCHAYLHR